MLPRERLTVTWNDGGVDAPLDLWVSQILLALSEDQQKEVMENVIDTIERLNAAQQAELDKLAEEKESGDTEPQSRPDSEGQDITTEDN